MFQKIQEISEAEETEKRLAAKGPVLPKAKRTSVFSLPELRIDAGSAVSRKEWMNYFVPNSHFRVCWDLLLFCGISFYTVACGLLLSAVMRQDFLHNYGPLLAASYCVDFIFLIDAGLRASLFGFEKQGVTVTKSRLIFAKYLRQKDLPLTVLTLFPFDLLFATIDFRLLPVFRLLKLLHVRKYQFHLRNVENALRRYFGITLSFEMSRFLALYIGLFELCHWIAVIWQLAADVSISTFGYHISWRVVDTHSDFFAMDYAGLSHTAFYFRAMYWAVNVMASIGFADMLATNPVETVVVICIMFIGYLLFHALLGAIATLMSSFNRDKIDFNNRVERTKALMKYKKIPPDVELKVLRFYEYTWARYGGVNETEVLAGLPKSLRGAVASYVMGPFLNRIPFFSICSEPMEQMIVSLFQPRVFLHDDALMLSGELGKEMFIIESGQVLVQSQDRRITFASLDSGSYIGESCLLDLTRRLASVYAVNYVDTYCLTSANFLKAAEKFPMEYGTIIEAVSAVMTQKREANATRSSEDLPDQLTRRISNGRDISIGSEGFSGGFSWGFGGFSGLWATLMRRVTADDGKIHPDSVFKMVWDCLIFVTLLYYSIIIPLRIVTHISVKVFIVDYLMDVVNLLDTYLYANEIALFRRGRFLNTTQKIRENFWSERAWIDFVAEFPYDIFCLVHVPYKGHYFQLLRAALRVPKMYKLLLLGQYFKQVERLSNSLGISFMFFRFLELTASILIVCHWVGCIFLSFIQFGRRTGISRAYTLDNSWLFGA
ncbi:hypothetical protein B484DRAFT_402133 [Ochromonadaceae sp. CCMP2298]|nr:hypothetical protein B484DRAFT_402133 [Ochromonadaceae sp. CCMP2298]